MKNIKDIKIIIKQVEGREGEYIAYYKSDFLDATYSVYFRDLCFIKHKSRYVVFPLMLCRAFKLLLLQHFFTVYTT